MKYSLWQNAWDERFQEPVSISLPDDWTVEFHGMPADDMPPVSGAEIRRSILPALREYLASIHSPKNAAIVFDDMSRGTHCGEIAGVVVDALLDFGIAKNEICFICAVGTHGALNAEDFTYKLGAGLVAEYPVFNHDAFDNLSLLGTTSEGIPVYLNTEVFNSDIRIGIGSVAPHPLCGYGGGGKLIYPGIAGYETTVRHHLMKGTTAPGAAAECPFRARIDEMMRMTPGFFFINTVLNAKCDNVAVFAGEPEEVYRRARSISERVNAITRGGPKDVIIINANAKGNEASISLRIAQEELKENGDIVLINFCRRGMVTHYGSGAFGRSTGGPRWVPYENRARQKHRRVIYYFPYADYAARYQFDEPDKVVFAKTWEQVMGYLSEYGSNTQAAVLSDGTISYYRR